MKKALVAVVVVCVLLGWNLKLNAQSGKDIPIDPHLAENSEKYKVKLGVYVMGKIDKYKFGDYKMLDGKIGATVTRGESNFFNTKSESSSKGKFWFTVGDKSPNKVRVNAATNTTVKVKQQAEIFSGFYVGEDQLLLNKSNFTATLLWNQDTSQMWLLFLKDSYGMEADDFYQGILTNGERTMHIVPVASEVPEKSLVPMTAAGYVLYEDGRSWAAVQYRGGGSLGMNRCFVWLHKDIDPATKLVISGALMALLRSGRESFFGIGAGGDIDD